MTFTEELARAPAITSPPLADMLTFIDRHGLAIDHIRIEQSGRLLFDCPFPSYDQNAPHALYSCTKTILGVLIGIAIDKGFLEGVDQPIGTFAPPDHPVRTFQPHLTLRHLLTMTAGLELVDHKDDFATLVRRRDLLDHVLRQPQRHAPGTHFQYSDGGCHVLCHALTQATGATPLSFAQEHLFAPLGMRDVRWDGNAQTGHAGWSGLRLLAGDFAKIGRLYLDGGVWHGRRIVSREWITQSLTGQVPAEDGQIDYGFLWWVDPRYYMAIGHLGQYLFAIPRYDATVVFYSSLDRERMVWPRRIMNSYILPALEQSFLAASHDETPSHVGTSDRGTGGGEPLTWRGAEDGSICKGHFRRSSAPAFSFWGQPRMKLDPLGSPDQVAALTTIDGFTVNAFVKSVPDGFDLRSAAELFRRGLIDCGAANAAKVVANTPFRFGDGTSGFRTNIEYGLTGADDITAVIASAITNGRIVWIEAHTPGDPAEMADIVESLRVDLTP